jgi:hypothetical protein
MSTSEFILKDALRAESQGPMRHIPSFRPISDDCSTALSQHMNSFLDCATDPQFTGAIRQTGVYDDPANDDAMDLVSSDPPRTGL